MIRRVETIELIGDDYNELMEMSEKDIKEKTNDGWKLIYHYRGIYDKEFSLTYSMEKFLEMSVDLAR